MHHSRGFAAMLACLQLLSSIGEADPVLDFPVNSQVPPVARTSQAYEFAFSISTFASTEGTISYTLSQQPSWLHLDSANRLLSGTPSAADVGATDFQLVATDTDGSTTSRVVLVVSSDGGPALGDTLSQQLARASRLSSPTSLLLYPLQAFAFTFTSKIFVNTTLNTEFYAVSADNAPLPNWIQFDATSITFSGTSPPIVSPNAISQIYCIKLIASNFPGFSQAIANFQIVVGYHLLSATDETQAVNVTRGQHFETHPLRQGLTLDGNVISDSDIVSVTSNAPLWTTLDTQNISLSGTPPANAMTTDITIVIADAYGDSINASVKLNIGQSASGFFNGDLPDANAILGQAFRYEISSDLLVGSNIRLSADLGNSSSWLRFFPKNLTFEGNVPKSISPGPESVTVTATNGVSSEQRNFDINVIRARVTSISSGTKSSITQASTSNPGDATRTANAGKPMKKMTNKRTAEYVLATVLPFVFIVFWVCLLLCCRRRRSKEKAHTPSMVQDQLSGTEVNASLPPPNCREVTLVPNPPSRMIRHGTPPGPPRIELPWAPDSLRISKDRISKKLGAKQSTSPDSSREKFVMTNAGASNSSPEKNLGDLEPDSNASQDNVPSLRKSTSNYSRKRTLLRSSQPRRQEHHAKRATKALSGISIATVGLPQRLSGAGHGAGGTAPPGFNQARSSWQTTIGSVPTTESGESMVMLRGFPSVPQEAFRVRKARSPNHPGNTTLRLVRSDSSHASSLETQRQKWYTQRARDRLEGATRFSSASSRPSSNSRIPFDAFRRGGGTNSSTLLSDNEEGLREHQQSWSRWSGTGPGGRSPSTGRHRSLGTAYIQTPSKLRRNPSLTSSGQFGSALSTDSQWEDENLIEEEVEQGRRQWSEAGCTPSPRLPFEPAVNSQENGPEGGGPLVPPRRARLVDSRRPVSVDDVEAKRAGRSEHGSLAFV